MGMGRNNVPQHAGAHKKPMAARVVLSCVTSYSHPFQNRTLALEMNTPVKIGRSSVHVLAMPTNAIFDCVVISRDHARMWFKDGKFYLQDTKSSNGTFVNNELIGEKAKDSPAKAIYSGDTVQFGSAVFSPDMKARLGAIIGIVRLYLPDGSEYPTRPTSAVAPIVPTAHLYQLASYLEEAAHTEQKLKKKLSVLQHIVETTSKAATEGWRASANEDHLLGRIDLLQRQLELCSKNLPEDKLRQEVIELTKSQKNIQDISKRQLEKLLVEKNEAIQKYEDLLKHKSNLETECAFFKTSCKQSQDDLKDLGQKYTIYFEKYQVLSQRLEMERTLQEKCNMFELEMHKLKESIQKEVTEKEKLQKRLEAVQSEGGGSGKENNDPVSAQEGNSGETVDSGGDISGTNKSKFTVTTVKANSESNVTSSEDSSVGTIDKELQVEKKRGSKLQDIPARVLQMCIRLEHLEKEEKCRIKKLETIKMQLQHLKPPAHPTKNVLASLKDRVDTLEKEMSLMWVSSNLSETHPPCSDLEGNVSDANGLITKLKDENASLNDQLAQAESNVSALEIEKGLQQIDLKNLTLKMLEFNHEIENLKDQLKQTRSTVNAKTNLIMELSKQRMLLDKSSEEGTQHLIDLRAKLEEEQSLQKTLTKNNELLQGELSEVQNNVRKIQEEVKTLRLSKANLEAKLKIRSVIMDSDSKLTDLEKTCNTLLDENQQLKLEGVDAEKTRKTLKAAQEDVKTLNQKLTDQMEVIAQMQVNVAEAEQRKSLFVSLVDELSGSKEMCSQLVDENADLLKKLISVQSQKQDNSMYVCLPVVVAVIVLFAIVLYPDRIGLRSNEYSSILEE